MVTTTQRKRQSIVLSAGFVEFKDSLRHFAMFKTSNPSLSDDLVQATFLKTWLYLKKGGQIRYMKTFLFHILRALIIDEYRKRTSISLDYLCENGFEPSDDSDQSSDFQLGNFEVIPLLEQLPKKYQVIMHMRYMDDLSIQEISQATKQSRNATTVQLHRGLVKIRDIYSATSLHQVL